MAKRRRASLDDVRAPYAALTAQKAPGATSIAVYRDLWFSSAPIAPDR